MQIQAMTISIQGSSQAPGGQMMTLGAGVAISLDSPPGDPTIGGYIDAATGLNVVPVPGTDATIAVGLWTREALELSGPYWGVCVEAGAEKGGGAVVYFDEGELIGVAVFGGLGVTPGATIMTGNTWVFAAGCPPADAAETMGRNVSAS